MQSIKIKIAQGTFVIKVDGVTGPDKAEAAHLDRLITRAHETIGGDDPFPLLTATELVLKRYSGSKILEVNNPKEQYRGEAVVY